MVVATSMDQSLNPYRPPPTAVGEIDFNATTQVTFQLNERIRRHAEAQYLLHWRPKLMLFSSLAMIAGSCAILVVVTELMLAAFLLTISAIGSMLPPQFMGNPDNAVWFTSNSDFAFSWLIIVRVIGGTGVGITSVVAPVYISELTLPENRGKIVSIYQLSITLGILLAFLMDWIVLHNAGDAAGIITGVGSPGVLKWLFVEEIWRGMFATEIPIALLFLILLFFIPESPRWLVTRGKAAEAMKTMIRIGGKDQAEAQMAEINKMENAESGGLKELFAPFLRIPLLIGVLLRTM